MDWNNQKLIEILQNGGVAIMPTDTLYGIVGSALNLKTVERIYDARKRNPEKPCIILISDMDELQKFGVFPTPEQQKTLARTVLASVEPVSFILDCPDDKLAYLHRGTKTLAFRISSQKELRDLLFKTGPLIAPSANIESMPPAKNISEAKNYFGDTVDLYLDGGKITGQASKIIKLHKDGTIDTLRN